MLGAVFTGNKTVELMQFEDPAPAADEVVIEIKASGMCGSDLKNYRAAATPDRPAKTIIAGHEPSGVVVAAGQGVKARPGRIGSRVMVHHYKGCGCCEDCMSGWTQLCNEKSATYGITAHGGHAKYLRVPADTLVELPDALSFDVGAAISCGSGTAWGALKRLGYSPRHPILVMGQGPVGLAVTQFASAMGGEIIVADVNDARLAQARDMGAHHAVNPVSEDFRARVMDITRGAGASMVVDTTGAPQGSLDAVRCAAKWGTVVFVGMGGTVTLDVSEHVIRKQLTIRGSWTLSKSWQAECARYVERNAVPVEKIFTNRWRLDQVEEAYRLFDRQAIGKSVIVF